MTRFALTVALALTLLLGGVSEAAKSTRHHRAPTPRPRVAEVTKGGVQFVPVALEGSLRSSWTQYGPGGVLEARAVVEGAACPYIFIDLQRSLMAPHNVADEKFLTVCAAAIPAGTRQAALAFPLLHAPLPPSGAGEDVWKEWIEKETGLPVPGPGTTEFDRQKWRDEIAARAKYAVVPLALPVSDPQRILVLGDTGCRIKDKTLQDCSDPAKWPFARIAAEAARLKPDLVIHVGDYLYRESACPPDFAGCAGTPFGDNWPTWDVDFFAPARPLLAVAPWVIVRGNHEDCGRAGPGFLRLLGPTAYDPAAPCAAHVAPYTVPLGSLDLVVLDNSDAPDTSVAEASVPGYRQELAALGQAKTPSWLVLHRPIWAAITGPLGMPIGGNLTTITAAGSTGIPAPVELMLAGHIHTFEAINYGREPRVPPQIVAGNGGDLLDETPSQLRGTVFQGNSGVRVSDGISLGGFGFLLMTRAGDGWTIDVHDWQGRIERQCVFRAGRVDCPARR